MDPRQSSGVPVPIVDEESSRFDVTDTSTSAAATPLPAATASLYASPAPGSTACPSAVAHETSPEYLGRGTCDACDAGSGDTPVKVWMLPLPRRVLHLPDGGSLHGSRVVLCKACLARAGHEAPRPKTAEDVP